MKQILTILVILLLVPVAYSVDLYGLAGGGATFTQGGKTYSTYFVGANVPIYSDDIRGYKTFVSKKPTPTWPPTSCLRPLGRSFNPNGFETSCFRGAPSVSCLRVV